MKKPKSKEKKVKTDWESIRDDTDAFTEGYRKILSKLKSAYIALSTVIAETGDQVHSYKEGDDGNVHLDEFDPKPFESCVNASLDVYMIQELCGLAKLEPRVKAKVISAYINRHKILRPIIPKLKEHSQTSQGTQVSFSQDAPKPSKK